MAERTPDTDPYDEPGGEQPPVGPALQALYTRIANHKVYAQVGENVRARIRPGIALQVIREAVWNRGKREKDPTIVPYFDETEVKRNIAQLQDNYGSTKSKDREQDKTRAKAISGRMAKAGLYDERSRSGLQPIHEINATYTLYEQTIAAGDETTQDSLELLLAAYGMSIETMNRQELS